MWRGNKFTLNFRGSPDAHPCIFLVAEVQYVGEILGKFG